MTVSLDAGGKEAGPGDVITFSISISWLPHLQIQLADLTDKCGTHVVQMDLRGVVTHLFIC